ncbi:PREDICTED: A disintegrin and metalloproteinase with thrombospondin motifs 20 isoform X2 [Nicrophorus vespilloides]|uniref:A disintegrin and metalloproteinase with thrombospondin motifs 20 isoform X2 n=1 Tax=Nicrophorus vespilloides TaxID=110193 RepID=A0ABM1M3S2_NICVS|nr:PREDICTED: A disintegrin and metalloproteinase with thrombospondin motifs 20 isoform X2 [Nicrophorus vespilloides]
MPCVRNSYDLFEGRMNTRLTVPQGVWAIFLLIMISLSVVGISVLLWLSVGPTHNPPPSIMANAPGIIDASNGPIKEHISDVEYVKPMKISPLPLNNHDLLYDQLRNHIDESPNNKHHSGHFRSKSAEVWDPHPRYEIDAFGKKLELVLIYNDKFVSQNLNVIHVWENYTQRIRHDPRSSGCYYSGNISDDPHSMVAVSLCHGMTGYIKTSDWTYYIEPAEDFKDNAVMSTILHVIRRSPIGVGNIDDYSDADHCETHQSDREEENVLFDEDVIEVNHSVKKRSIMPYGRVHVEHNVQPYIIEIVVVADKKMAQYHKNESMLRDYILTLMSHVALLFKDATIGNPITLAVVDIIIHNEEKDDRMTSQMMLNNFCLFKQNHTKKHDVALLLTRGMICKSASRKVCNTLGVAEVGSMCTDSNCAIVRDKGLSTSYTIAHELGHVLSMPHDDDDKCKNYNVETKNNYIMSKVLHNDTKPWHWSKCSKHFLTEFLDSPRSFCLNNIPKTFMEKKQLGDTIEFPGESFEGNKQCELEFGARSRICSFMPYCGSLWCTTDEYESDGCRTQYMPWADGTFCAPGRWCHHGKCIDQDNNIKTPINGSWGSWQNWGSCSRTCGGGIKMSIRECNNPPPAYGGSYCTGGRTMYASCNTQPCKSSKDDFRLIQCSKFNKQNKSIPGLGENVTWIPKYLNKDDYCKLYCRPNTSSEYYLLQDKVIDGTKCGLNTFDICINGICKNAGCDNTLGSNASLDECGICEGDNSTCEIVSGFHNLSSFGYNSIIKIPTGSSNLLVTQKNNADDNADENYLVLRDSITQNYILNGNYVISVSSKELGYGGLTIFYSGSKENVESLRTERNFKLTKDLLLDVLSVGNVRPPDIQYRYTISSKNAPKYGWTYQEDRRSTCSSICDGKQTLKKVCKHLAKNFVVEDKDCRGISTSYEPKNCNTHCVLQWTVVSKGHCSVHCGQGNRTLTYNCVKKTLSTGEEITVNEKHCSALPPYNPYEICTGSCDSTYWRYSDWSKCTKTCGGGNQMRSAVCTDQFNRNLDDYQCNLNKKVLRQRCNTNKCPEWSIEDKWSTCSVTCGHGYKIRQHACHIDGRVIDANQCNRNDLGKVRMECYTACTDPNAVWITDLWSNCSSPCGPGTQTRQVTCENKEYQRLDDNNCSHLKKPSDFQHCDNQCSEEEDNNVIKFYWWLTSHWSACNSSCRGGVKSRRVVCINMHHKEVDSNNCDYQSRPIDRASCNQNIKCNWDVSMWTECNNNCEKYRFVSCPSSYCDHTKQPKSRRICKRCPANRNHMQDNRYRWIIYKWSECSVSCGRGVRKREVSCVDTKFDTFHKHCPESQKPKTTQVCDIPNCKYMIRGDADCSDSNCNDLYRWVPGNWSGCTHTCGKMGRQKRNLKCIRKADQIPVEKWRCPKHARPKRKRKCNQIRCRHESCKDVKHHLQTIENKDYVLSVEGRDALLYCYKMDTKEPEEFISLKPNTENYAEMYRNRLRDSETCPYNGYRMDHCDCVPWEDQSGFTVFWKIRLNITTMQIIPDDFTFSSQKKHSGNVKVPYGTAGDCYSSQPNCIQGRFSIDLTNTSFRLSRNVEWTVAGYKASKLVNFEDNKVMGKCGGYCGHCAPRPDIGLKIEVT